MPRWLWALLGGVVLVAIAAAFWTASNRTNVSPPVSPEPTAVAPAPVPPAPLLPRRSSTNARRRPLPPRLRRKPRRHLRRRPCSRPQPRPPPRRPLPLARPRLRPSCRLLPLRSLPLLIRRRMQDSKRHRRPLSRRALAPPRLRPSSPRSLRLLQLRRSPNRHCRSPRLDGRSSKSQAYLRPRTSRS